VALGFSSRPLQAPAFAEQPGVCTGIAPTLAPDDGCRSYVKRLSLFAVIWARVPGSVGGGHGRFGSEA
jgi:hypothetical protein